MEKEPPPLSSAAFDLNELARLNEELRQLRESVRRKRLERDKARREGKRTIVDLGPELLRLNRFIEELDQLREKLKSSALAKTDREASDAEALRNVLLQTRNQLLTEKETLEEENTMGELQEQLKREAEELRVLREQLAKDKETLEKEREALESTLARVKEEQARLKSMSAEARPEIPGHEPTDLKHTYDHREAEELKDRRLEFLIDQLSVIKTELRDVREHLAREERALESKQRELDEDRYRIREERRTSESMITQDIATVKLELGKFREEKRASETKIAQEIGTTKLELEKFREQLAKEQETVESRINQLAKGRERIEEERKALDTRIAEAQDDHTKRTIQRIRNELQSERIELASLKKSIQQIKAASIRERKTIERDRDAILRVQIKLEREKQRIAQRAALLALRERRARIIGGMQRRVKRGEIKKKRTSRAVERGRTEKHSTTEQFNQRRPIEGEGVILGVKLGAEDYGIDTTQVREIIRMRQITPIPRQPSYVEGVMNVRGAIIPVVNLKKRFGLRENGSKHPHIVIVESSKGLVGMLVDSVTEVVRVPAELVHPPPQVTKGIDSEYLRGICRLGEKLMIYLDLEKLLRQAVPIKRTSGLQSLSSRKSDLSELSKDERRIVNAISRTGRTTASLGRRVGLSTCKLDRLISSLKVRGLIQVTRVGNSKLIRRKGS
jgi:purine-binding chemotaxis protein CheW